MQTRIYRFDYVFRFFFFGAAPHFFTSSYNIIGNTFKGCHWAQFPSTEHRDEARSLCLFPVWTPSPLPLRPRPPHPHQQPEPARAPTLTISLPFPRHRIWLLMQPFMSQHVHVCVPSMFVWVSVIVCVFRSSSACHTGD